MLNLTNFLQKLGHCSNLPATQNDLIYLTQP